MNELDVRQLRYFVAVAEELHFGRAAERLSIAQPPLSRTISDMERMMGVALLERTTRQVRLTAAGEVLLRDARLVLDSIAAATRRAQRAGQGDATLRLAVKVDYDGGLLPRVLAAYHRDGNPRPVELMLGDLGEQVQALRDGRADVALVPAPFDDRGLDTRPVLTEPRFVALAAGDPLAGRPSLRLADLKGKVLADGTPATLGPVPSEPATDDGAAPCRDLTHLLNLIELGRAVWFPPASVAARNRRSGVTYVPVEDLTPAELVLAWPRGAQSPAVSAFVRAVSAVVDEDPDTATEPRGDALASLAGVSDLNGQVSGRPKGDAGR
ncbi:LysR substrate-binding domain-containing protein [Actinocrispum sp. NPDC049592]|uniref:LysR family transcriptional regulator n=1 Tax=Actinocrispum sp. NPDC049592 TaxID=3154835 RepID=UPI00344A1D4B